MRVLSFVSTIVALAAIYAILTLALNLHFGMGGLINFGIVAYFSLGAYSYAIATQRPPSLLDQYRFGLEWPPWAGILVAIVAAIAFALITGWPSLRLRTEYLALTTFAFAEVLNSILLNDQRIANGSRGLPAIYPPFADRIGGRSYNLYFMLATLVVLALVLAIQLRIARSPFGMTLRAIRDDELAAASLGKRAQRFRLDAFLAGAAIAAIAGVMYAWYTSLVAPSLFKASVTFTAFIALVLGGVGSNVGAIVGAFVLFGAQEAIRFLPLSSSAAQLISSLRLVPFGLVLILVLRFRASGLVGKWAP